MKAKKQALPEMTRSQYRDFLGFFRVMDSINRASDKAFLRLLDETGSLSEGKKWSESGVRVVRGRFKEASVRQARTDKAIDKFNDQNKAHGIEVKS